MPQQVRAVAGLALARGYASVDTVPPEEANTHRHVEQARRAARAARFHFSFFLGGGGAASRDSDGGGALMAARAARRGCMPGAGPPPLGGARLRRTETRPG